MKQHPEFHYTLNDFVQALERIGISRGDVVFCHSNVGFFGLAEGARRKEDHCALILKGFREVLGSEGTLVVPTFTYSFPAGNEFNVQKTPSNCGVFTEFVRQTKGALRSVDPNVSVAAIGGRAEELTCNAPVNAYSPLGFFGRFETAAGKICNLNFDAGSTYIHYVERCLRVPYRFDKSFQGIVTDGAQRKQREATIWVRYVSSSDTVADFIPFSRLAGERGISRTAQVGRGQVLCIGAKETRDLIQETLPTRPWLLTLADSSGTIPELLPE